MTVTQRRRWTSTAEVRLELSARLRRRQHEIEKAVLDRVVEVELPEAVADAEYVVGVRGAVREAVDYALSGIEMGEVPIRAVPLAASAQARRAARNGVPLDTILRRYHAGDRLIYEVIMGEAHDLPCEALQDILRDHGPLVDHLTAGIATEYMHEVGRVSRTPVERLSEQVKKLLTGPPGSDAEIEYPLDGWHTGLIARGRKADQAILRTGNALGRLVLCVPGGDPDTFWVWLGGPRPLTTDDLGAHLARELPEGVSIALGEPRKGLDGWRQTHQEAQIALGVTLRRQGRMTRCRDVILISAVMRDQSLTSSLIATYLTPLDDRGDFGRILRETLYAYFKADRNIATAASALGVHRQTVERRLRSVEEKIGATIDTCSAQLQVALSVEELLRTFRTSTRESHD